MEAYEQWLARDGCNVEPAVLRLLGLFDRPAIPDCLGASRPGTGHLDEAQQLAERGPMRLILPTSTSMARGSSSISIATKTARS